jgi:hypothetical protein
MVLPVGLYDPDIKITGANGFEISDGAFGTFDQTAQTVFLAMDINQLADGSTDRVINPGDRTCTNGKKRLILRRTESADGQQQADKKGSV